MKPTCYLVANASRARFFRRADPMTALVLVRSFAHPASRSRAADLVAAAPGHGRGAATYAPRHDPHQQEPLNFARELAHFVGREVAAGRCDALVIAAPARFLGEVRAELDEPSRRRITSTLCADLGALPTEALDHRLESALAAA